MRAGLVSLRDRELQLLKEKEEILAELKSWDEEISWKKYAAEELEKTLEALRQGSDAGQLPRCAAELRQGTASTQSEEIVLEDTDELQQRLSAALADLSKPLENPWDEESFKRQFDADDDQLADFLKDLTAEQRLVWELQNVPEVSPRLDQRLIADLKKAGKKAEVDVLSAAAGAPSDAERQYRALLWLHHKDLNVSYVEPGAGSQSLLTIACRHGHCDVAAALLERKADINHRSSSQLTALSAACERGSTSCARLLLQAAADCNEASKGCSMLAVAARCTAPDQGLALTKLLLAFRADTNQADPFGQTPLMVAAAARNPRCCEALLEAGACVTDEDNEGKSAAKRAKEQGLDGLAAKLCADEKWKSQELQAA
eukprot:s62_g28.t2